MPKVPPSTTHAMLRVEMIRLEGCLATALKGKACGSKRRWIDVHQKPHNQYRFQKMLFLKMLHTHFTPYPRIPLSKTKSTAASLDFILPRFFPIFVGRQWGYRVCSFMCSFATELSCIGGYSTENQSGGCWGKVRDAQLCGIVWLLMYRQHATWQGSHQKYISSILVWWILHTNVSSCACSSSQHESGFCC
jgi:hypothetical protein